MPWHEFVQAGDFMVGDAGERVGEPGLRIDAIELCGFDQCIGNGSGVASALRTYKQPAFSACGVSTGCSC